MKRMCAICLTAAAIVLAAGCAASKKTSGDYTVQEMELVGVGRGKDANWNTARNIAMTAALGDLSMKMDSRVRTATSDYQKRGGNVSRGMFESLTEVVSENHLQGVKYTGDKRALKQVFGVYTFQVEARIDYALVKRNIDSILQEFDVTSEDRAEFRRQMFGDD